MVEIKEKDVKMEATPEATRPEKMSYEQLENIAHQLSNQAKQLYAKLQEANMVNMFKRLDYLFKVVENARNFPVEFVTKCITEIMDLMTVPETEEGTEDKPKE